VKSQARTQHFHTLDGLRGLAAIAVVMLHAWYLFSPAMRPGSAYLAVDFFFCLSGFVICHAYGERIREGLGTRAFVWVRVVRLGPLFVLGQCIGLVQTLMQGFAGKIGGRLEAREDLIGVISFTGIPSPPFRLSDRLYPLDGPAWSLLFEMIINIVFVLQLRSGRRGLLPACMTLGLGLAILFAIRQVPLNGGGDWPTVLVGLARVCWSFPAGVMIYALWSRGVLAGVRVPNAALYAVLGVLLFVTPSPALRGLYDIACIAVIFPLMVLVGAHRASEGPIARFEALLGRTSYPVYITHAPLALLYGGIFTRLTHHDAVTAAPLSGLIFLPCVIGAALAFDRYFDVPVRAWLGRQAKAPRRRASDAALPSGV
jgi:peptidoglycan/LPS O-acetylase OafA/YrhL